ncbi:orange carotenoid protein N-terminal domain-containing protein [Chroococcus sp. FPU101]|uniref:orange carotenoid protein N-terminal domain-containing protein n=1 Tax=Chroococcus sp. FPU101 TaxID=1974212 RepID=UPI001A8DFD38|nr:orange carotenoid protein N-terminal domain-containing protein [Chroococcus sp. FPU101]GFE69314.1 Orange carotenoid protein [Chroococcus sp. FPU101]
MTYTANPTTQQALDLFQGYDVDTQLALLWFGYLDIKDELNPAPPTSVETMGNTLYDQIKVLSPEEQLQAQRDMLQGADNEIGKAYQAFDSSARMESWLLIARGMEEGTVIQVPDDYKLPDQTQEFTDKIKQLDFQERINFMRSAVGQ